jgi:hypothetical protein
MYYERLIKDLSENLTIDNCLATIINPFSLYYLCDHYYGDETKEYNIPLPYDKNDILVTNNLYVINDFDIIHVQVNYLEKFTNNILPNIKKKIILSTGQWNLPQIHISKLSENILNNNNIICNCCNRILVADDNEFNLLLLK